MLKKTILLLLVVSGFCSGALSAQQTKSSKEEKAESMAFPIPANGIRIRVIPTATALLNPDDPLTSYTQKLKTGKVGQDWLFVEISFNTLRPSSVRPAWPQWLDDVEVSVEIFIPGRDEEGKDDYIILHGVQTLNPIRTDVETHRVRFFIPPYVINRYIFLSKTSDKGKNNSGELKKIAEHAPICASIKYKNVTVYGIQKYGKTIYDKFPSEWKAKLPADINSARDGTLTLFKFLRSQRKGMFFYLENAILPAAYTPWAWLDWDKFESMKMEQPRSK